MNGGQMPLDRNAMASALFLPLLLWMGVVIAVSLSGEPGVVCMTPLAWLLGLTVGLRVGRESVSPGTQPIKEAAICGAILGFWEGALFSAVMAASPWLPGSSFKPSDIPNPYLIGAVAILISTPITAGLAVISAWRILKLERS